MDETGLQLNNQGDFVIAQRSCKNVAAEKTKTIAVISCCNPGGLFLPPQNIFKEKNKKTGFEDRLPGSVVYLNQKFANIIFLKLAEDAFYTKKAKWQSTFLIDRALKFFQLPDLTIRQKKQIK